MDKTVKLFSVKATSPQLFGSRLQPGCGWGLRCSGCSGCCKRTLHRPALTHSAASCGFCTVSIPVIGSRPFKWKTTFEMFLWQKDRSKDAHSSVFFHLFLAEWELFRERERAAFTKNSQGQEPTYVRKNIQQDKKHYVDWEWPWRRQPHAIVLRSLCQYDY